MTSSNQSPRRPQTSLKRFAIASLIVSCLCPTPLLADIDTEEKFETVFVTAGYSAALGAGIGLALLAFTPEPGERMQRHLATGAATGFLAGAALGGYLVLRPDPGSHGDKLDPKKKALGPEQQSRTGLRLDWTIARF